MEKFYVLHDVVFKHVKGMIRLNFYKSQLSVFAIRTYIIFAMVHDLIVLDIMQIDNPKKDF